MNASANRPTPAPRAIALLAAAGLLLSAAAGCTRDQSDGDQGAEEESRAPAATGDQESEARKAPPAAGDLSELAGSYELDAAHSFVLFRAKRMDMSYVHGMFTGVEGEFELAADPAESSFEVTVDPSSLFTGVKKRDDHLKSPDFLNAKQFPEIKLASKEIRPAGEDEFEVTGELTLHGKKKEIEATLTRVGAGPNPMDESKQLAGFHSQFTVPRSEFGIDFMSDGIGDDIRITVDVLGVRE